MRSNPPSRFVVKLLFIIITTKSIYHDNDFLHRLRVSIYHYGTYRVFKLRSIFLNLQLCAILLWIYFEKECESSRPFNTSTNLVVNL